ncbi:MAG: hypothetical protein Q4D62_07045 [Planctomycetia bacterium]|nr:hypothetical protein [Planctomycetia bacterium]
MVEGELYGPTGAYRSPQPCRLPRRVAANHVAHHDRFGTRQLLLVPYGCAKLRVSMFPVVEK